MKTILFSFLIFLFFYGCSNDNLVNTNNFNSPPAQQNEFDLIGFEGKSIFTFEVNPINPNYIIVSTKSPRGLYLTSNFGRNWTLIDSNIVTTAMKYSLNNPETIYLCNVRDVSNHYYGLVYKSTNYGRSFSGLDSSLRTWPMARPLKIEIDPLNTEIFYLHLGSYIPTDPADIIISRNGGKNINHLSSASNSYSQLQVQDILDICVNPKRTGSIFTIGSPIYNDPKILYSTDFGENWAINDFTLSSFMKKISCFDEIIVIGGNNSLAISIDNGKNFSIVSTSNFEYTFLNEILVTNDKKIFISLMPGINSKNTLIYLSDDKGQSWKKLSNDTDYKYNLRYDSNNRFLYMIKEGNNSGLYRFKL